MGGGEGTETIDRLYTLRTGSKTYKNNSETRLRRHLRIFNIRIRNLKITLALKTIFFIFQYFETCSNTILKFVEYAKNISSSFYNLNSKHVLLFFFLRVKGTAILKEITHETSFFVYSFSTTKEFKIFIKLFTSLFVVRCHTFKF